MKAILRMIAAAFLFAAVSCDKTTPTSEAAPHSSQFAEMETYRSETRQHYNNRRFAKLEEIADKTRSGKERLADGGWKIIHFYESLLSKPLCTVLQAPLTLVRSHSTPIPASLATSTPHPRALHLWRKTHGLRPHATPPNSADPCPQAADSES